MVNFLCMSESFMANPLEQVSQLCPLHVPDYFFSLQNPCNLIYLFSPSLSCFLVAAAENTVFTVGAESWPVLWGVLAQCQSDWEQRYGPSFPGEVCLLFAYSCLVYSLGWLFFLITSSS